MFPIHFPSTWCCLNNILSFNLLAIRRLHNPETTRIHDMWNKRAWSEHVWNDMEQSKRTSPSSCSKWPLLPFGLRHGIYGIAWWIMVNDSEIFWVNHGELVQLVQLQLRLRLWSWVKANSSHSSALRQWDSMVSFCCRQSNWEPRINNATSIHALKLSLDPHHQET